MQHPRFRPVLLLVLSATLVSMMPWRAVVGAAVRPPKLEYQRLVLPNGLTVILHEDHSTPITHVALWYHVGSKNERQGQTGFAHLFEHLMFEGSEHHNTGFFPPLQQAGAILNGSTNADRTNYWEVVPTSAVDLALWMESDRMGYLLPALTSARFENQRDVVLNERRQNYENRPYGLAVMAVVAALYPPNHPYHWLTIGAADDIRAMRFDDVREFFRTYYHPANASLALAGDIDSETAVQLAEKYFAEIPAGPLPEPVRAEASIGREIRLVLEDRVEMPRLYIGWHSPAMFDDGDAEMDLLSDLLANGKASRLYRTLVYERRIALDISASQGSRELGHSGGDRPGAAARDGRWSDQGRDGTRRSAGGGTILVQAADRRRVRRQVRSAQRIQRVPRRPRLLHSRSREVSAGNSRVAPRGGQAMAALRSARRAQRRPTRAGGGRPGRF
jgi:zinc protease